MNDRAESDLPTLLQAVTQIAARAGEAILDVYSRETFEVTQKADASPLTQADTSANRIILDGLAAISRLPVLTEEAAEIPYETRRGWSSYWLVDPLDGTREFLSRNGEFTVNIALISGHEPALGVVYAPATGALYAGSKACSIAWRQLSANGQREPIAVTRSAASPLRVVGSRSHQDPATSAYLERLRPYSLLAIGSSLKLCLVAEGSADLYPRFGPTSEWDIGAGHAVLLAAGGDIRQSDGALLRYNTKPGIINPAFIAYGDQSRDWTPGKI